VADLEEISPRSAMSARTRTVSDREEIPQKGAMSAKTTPPVHLKHIGCGPNGSPWAMRRAAGFGVAGTERAEWLTASPTSRNEMGGQKDGRFWMATSLVSPYRWDAEGKSGVPPLPVPESLRSPGSKLPRDVFKSSGRVRLKRLDRELFSKPDGPESQGADPTSKRGPVSGALLAAQGAPDADSLGAKACADTGKLESLLADRPVAEQFCSTLARELDDCQDESEVDKLLRLLLQGHELHRLRHL
jgi:hypothetical protein